MVHPSLIYCTYCTAAGSTYIAYSTILYLHALLTTVHAATDNLDGYQSIIITVGDIAKHEQQQLGLGLGIFYELLHIKLHVYNTIDT